MLYLYCVEIEGYKVKIGVSAAPKARFLGLKKGYGELTRTYVYPKPSIRMRLAEGRIKQEFKGRRYAGSTEVFVALCFDSLVACARLEAGLVVLSDAYLLDAYTRKYPEIKGQLVKLAA